MTSHGFFSRLEQFGPRIAIVWHGRRLTYAAAAERLAAWEDRLAGAGLAPGAVCGVLGDHSAEALLALLAAWRQGLVAVPICSLPPHLQGVCLRAAGAEAVISFDAAGRAHVEHLEAPARPPLVDELRRQAAPGVVLFSSGSTGQPKAVLWNAHRLLERHGAAAEAPPTLAFLRLDHIGGLNTILYSLCGGGTLVVPPARDPLAVCHSIAEERIELLPTTPTFLRMLLLSDAWRTTDISSLKRITYGAEPMPETVLRALAEALPWVDLKQTYGLSELGILPTQSRGRDSLWLRIGGAGVQTRVVDGELWVRAPAAMLGYLDAASPLNGDGWFNTGDAVEVEGDCIRILGRAGDTINVGGEKVHPAAVENVLLAADNVRSAVVYGRSSPVTGQVVAATVALAQPEDTPTAELRLIAHCRQRLPAYAAPVLIDISAGPLHNERCKLVRPQDRRAS